MVCRRILQVFLAATFLAGSYGGCKKSNTGEDRSNDPTPTPPEENDLSFSGQVHGDDVSGVEVTLDCDGETVTATTGTDGSFTFAELDPCSYLATLAKGGCTFLTSGTSEYGRQFTIEINSDTSQTFYINCTGYNFERSWGGPGTDLFNNLQSVVVDSSENIWSVDLDGAACRIRKWDASGNLLADWSKEVVYGSSGLDVDVDGFIYVTSFNTNDIMKFNSAGDLDTSWTIQGTGTYSSQLKGIAVDANGFVYVSDGGNNRVQKFSNSGSFVTEWGSQGSRDGQFDSPIDLDVDSEGNVYVLDAGNSRVQKFDPEGNFIFSFGEAGEETGQLGTPQGIAIDQYDNIYVADQANERVQKFFPDGTYVLILTSTALSPFRVLTDVAIDSSGNIYTVESTTEGRVQKFVPSPLDE